MVMTNSTPAQQDLFNGYPTAARSKAQLGGQRFGEIV